MTEHLCSTVQSVACAVTEKLQKEKTFCWAEAMYAKEDSYKRNIVYLQYIRAKGVW